MTSELHWYHLGMLIFVVSSLFTNATVVKQQHDIKVLQQESRGRGREVIALSKSNNRILEIILDVTSPEAQAKSDARTNEAIKRLDCNDQRTMQSVLNELSAQHGEEPTVIMSSSCVQFFIDNPPNPGE